MSWMGHFTARQTQKLSPSNGASCELHTLQTELERRVFSSARVATPEKTLIPFLSEVASLSFY